MKTPIIALAAIAATLVTGIVQAETLRNIATETNASYALDTDSIVQSNGKTAFTAQTIYINKMTAPNNAAYNRATNTFLADCKAQTIALTSVKLIDGSGKVVFTDTPTVQQAPMITPEKNSISAKILQTVCAIK